MGGYFPDGVVPLHRALPFIDENRIFIKEALK